MRKLTSITQWVALAAVLATPVFISGCAVHAAYYDPGYSDYHRWGPPEVGFYSRWETDTHRSHRDFRRRSAAEQREYWNWRHNHR